MKQQCEGPAQRFGFRSRSHVRSVSTSFFLGLALISLSCGAPKERFGGEPQTFTDIIADFEVTVPANWERIGKDGAIVRFDPPNNERQDLPWVEIINQMGPFAARAESIDWDLREDESRGATISISDGKQAGVETRTFSTSFPKSPTRPIDPKTEFDKWCQYCLTVTTLFDWSKTHVLRATVHGDSRSPDHPDFQKALGIVQSLERASSTA